LIEPFVVGWGWGEYRPFTYGSDYLDYLQWQGTRDMAVFLCVPAAIRFQADHHWDSVRGRCHNLLREAVERIAVLTGLDSPYPDDSLYGQMAVATLPPIGDLRAFKARLFSQYKVQVPCVEWNGRQFVRISIQGYNTPEDVDRLLAALTGSLSFEGDRPR
jgi:isopenicillin-N epimerase